MGHRVKRHNWINGTLQTLENFFESLEDAMAFVETVDFHTIKVYDADNELVHVQTVSGIPEQISSRYLYSGLEEESYSGVSTYA
jgi:hypothetical protein